ncbi:hypothetical protein DY037_00910 [Apilactobacillus micheneri]|uniref:Uncharacterized protein n=1 Tax=Apilactobacillus micheneri TaxID=1899430 RepID=A0A9Q8MU82_9LACO|nr:hypothetical protein [Apilactobacillus micheneri]TPR39968.1 hypothetical protein DY121_03800 [Apilactobacillus micheneri]TPR41781.1 hypothetical protein DY123_04430 [Apilactobacillus micheneri]TPR44170.1 hypothetical protein DY130_03795 [Apilactobacillus micheneri]TPR45794.1 hypothetical protein DY128_03795 [Apilactobacillus micheneri]TPR50538.1 hypothetical protein DY037_00910 [Apilactobacillus micheneri]
MTSTTELRNMLTLDYEMGPFISLYVTFKEISNKNEYLNLIQNIKTKFINKYDESLWSRYERKLKKFNFDRAKHVDNGTGFALFVSVKAIHSFTLTKNTDTKVMMSDTMDIIPLIKEIETELHYRLLVLEKNSFRLYRVDNGKINEFNLVNKPISILLDNDQNKFYQLVDEYITDMFKDDDYLPTVLIANDENHNLYAKIAKQPKLLKDITYEDDVNEDNLNDIVDKVNQQFYKAGTANNKFNYEKAKADNAASDDLNEIIYDATAGKIDTLFINEDNYEKLYNDLAITTIGFAGEVFVLSKEDMPVNANCAVINRQYV